MNKSQYNHRQCRGLALSLSMFLLACSGQRDGELPYDSYGETGDDLDSGFGDSAGGETSGGGVGSSAAAGAAPGMSGSAGGTTSLEKPRTPYAPSEGMLRRLTRPQFANALRDIFDFEVDVRDIDADIHIGDFAVVGAASVVTSDLGVEQYGAEVEAAVDSVFNNEEKRNLFIGCQPTTVDDACVVRFVESLGRRSWRRPLEPLEVKQLLGVAQVAADELSNVFEGVRWATVTLFASPHFLYRPELGKQGADGSHRLTSYETASRLAFLIYNSLPDDRLLDDAANGALSTGEDIRAVAARLLTESAGREAVGAFAEDYLRLDRILSQAKDPVLYPEYTAGLRRGMVMDVRSVWEIIAFDEEANVLDLFSTKKVVANLELAGLYGLDIEGLTSDSFREFSLPVDSPRVGILAKAGVLSQFANQKEGSPTLRGKFVREAMMCQPVKPPPPGIALELRESTSDEPKTKRQRLELHRASPACASCHSMMDPMGLPYENFDAIGNYRAQDNGLPIDPSGEFEGTPVADSKELGHLMATSDTIASCLVRKYYSYAMGYEERDEDALVVDELTASFQASGYRIKQLILDLVGSEAFAEVAPQTH